MTGQMVAILSPAAAPMKTTQKLPDRVNTLRGKSVGVYDNFLWANFGRFADRLEELLKKEMGVSKVVRLRGVDPTSSKAPGKGMTPGKIHVSDAALNAFAEQVDTAIVGLGA